VIIQLDIKMRARITLLEFAQQRHNDGIADRHGSGHADQTVHLQPAVLDLVQRLVQQAQAGVGQLEQARALVRQAQAARGAMKQAHAQMILQLPHRLADGLRRQTGVDCGLTEALGAHHADEQTDDPRFIHIFIYNQKVIIKQLSYG
jgi:hypothetical protein